LGRLVQTHRRHTAGLPRGPRTPSEERPTLEELLSGLDRDRLQALLLSLAEDEPRLAAAVEARVALTTSATTAASEPSGSGLAVPRPPVDPRPFHRQVREAIRGMDYSRSTDFYSQMSEAVEGVRTVLDQARAFTRVGDGANALIVLEALTEEFMAGYEGLDDSYGHVGDLFHDLGPAWAEALLTADPAPDERDRWAGKLESWQRELDSYGVDEALDVALEAAEQGWDFPPLQRVLREGTTDREESEVESALWDEELVAARLNVLERQGRLEEYLRLARAAGQIVLYTTMLLRLGRVDEAVEHGLGRLAEPEEALALAKALRERGELERALRIAQHGLTLEGRRAELASWLRDLAAGMGRMEEALSAALVAFEESPELATYLRVRDLAGEGWPALRDRLLEQLRRVRSYYPSGPVDVFLHEGLIDDAIVAVAEGATHTLVGRVADAAVESRPEWVIAASRGQADAIMDEGKAQYYDSAVRWLGRAKRAYHLAGREPEWRSYLEELLARHSRKYKLVPMLKALK